MTHTETASTQRPSYSTDKERKTIDIRLAAPTAWRELTQEQLRYVFGLLADYDDPTVVKTMMLVSFCGISIDGWTRRGWKCRVRADGRQRTFFLATWQVQSFIGQFAYVDQLEDMDCRLDAVCGLHAADALLHGVTFADYLMAEKYYQMFVSTQQAEWLDHVAMWLYRDRSGRAAGTGEAVGDDGRKVEELTLTTAERVGMMLWYGHVKRVMADAFPHFFHATDGDAPKLSGREIRRLYDVQLRALTGGDATKEKAVLDLDCWRALTELDAKAREAEEWERIRAKK